MRVLGLLNLTNRNPLQGMESYVSLQSSFGNVSYRLKECVSSLDTLLGPSIFGEAEGSAHSLSAMSGPWGPLPTILRKGYLVTALNSMTLC